MKPKRIVEPPWHSTRMIPGEVIRVELAEDEDVKWIWTHTGGRSIVTGYEIVKKTDPMPPSGS